jgi:hypothetical protein
MILNNTAKLKRIHYNYTLQFRVENQKRIENLKRENEEHFSLSNIVLLNELIVYDKVLKSELIELDTQINELCHTE